MDPVLVQNRFTNRGQPGWVFRRPPLAGWKGPKEFAKKWLAGACQCQLDCIQLCMFAAALCAGSFAGAGGFDLFQLGCGE